MQRGSHLVIRLSSDDKEGNSALLQGEGRDSSGWRSLAGLEYVKLDEPITTMTGLPQAQLDLGNLALQSDKGSFERGERPLEPGRFRQ